MLHISANVASCMVILRFCALSTCVFQTVHCLDDMLSHPDCMLDKQKINQPKEKHNPVCIMLTVVDLHPVLSIATLTQDPDQPIPSVVRPQPHPVPTLEAAFYVALWALHDGPFCLFLFPFSTTQQHVLPVTALLFIFWLSLLTVPDAARWQMCWWRLFCFLSFRWWRSC